MIPKKIHYCWFGGAPMQDIVVKCISSWKKYFPDYEIIEWNEKNYNVSCSAYIKEAYDARKWAFVSDYARFDILYKYGGLYFDTDVEIINSFDDIIKNGNFFACEYAYAGSADNGLTYVYAINPGLVIGTDKENEIIKKILIHYNDSHFLNVDGTYNYTSVVERVTNIFAQYGFEQSLNNIQKIQGFYIYPPEYFCPINYLTGEMNVCLKTKTIHHYTASWLSKTECTVRNIESLFVNRMGYRLGKLVGRCFSAPFRIKVKVEKMGVRNTLKFTREKLFEEFRKMINNI